MAGEKTIDSFIIDQFSYLESLTSRGIRTDLRPMRGALSLLDHPEEKVPVVLVGGTNGKGSVVAMTGEIVGRAWNLVGCYFSPHVSDVRERIVLGGTMVGREEMAGLIGRVRGGVDGKVDLTYFEFLTLAAYLCFVEKRVDLAVMEVGMGGRFDATNVGDPVVSVVTTVSLDHTDYLGETEGEIAREKAEIVHRGGTLVAGRVSDGVKDVLKEHARGAGVRAFFLGEDFYVEHAGGSGAREKDRFSYRGMRGELRGLRTGLVGSHQLDNAAVALAVVELLTYRGYRISDATIREGLASARLTGRMERISENPEVIVDVAHNPAGAKVLADYVRTLPKRPTALVIGMMGDKDIAGFLRELNEIADVIILAAPGVPRAASLADMKAAASPLVTPVRLCEAVQEALVEAKDLVGEDGRVVVTGSFYTVGEAMGEIEG